MDVNTFHYAYQCAIAIQPFFKQKKAAMMISMTAYEKTLVPAMLMIYKDKYQH